MFSHVNAVVSRSKATNTAYTLLLLLAYRANAAGYVSATVEHLARAAHASRASVQRALRKLEELGELEVRPGQGGRGLLLRIRLAPQPQWDDSVALWGYQGTPGAEGPQNEAPLGAEGPQNATEGPHFEAGGPQNEAEGPQNEAPYIEETKKQEETKEASSSRPPTREEAEDVCLVEQALGNELLERLREVVAPRMGEGRWRTWLEMVLRPELERLGREGFRAAVRAALAEASGPDVRFPARLVEVRLKQAEPSERRVLTGGDPGEIIEDLLTPELLEEAPQEMPATSLEFLEAIGLDLACPHCGSRPARSDCCVPRAKEQVLAFYPTITGKRFAPVVDRTELEGVLQSLVRAGRRLIREGVDPTTVEDPREQKVLQEGLEWVRWALGVIESRASRAVEVRVQR